MQGLLHLLLMAVVVGAEKEDPLSISITEVFSAEAVVGGPGRYGILVCFVRGNMIILLLELTHSSNCISYILRLIAINLGS